MKTPSVLTKISVTSVEPLCQFLHYRDRNGPEYLYMRINGSFGMSSAIRRSLARTIAARGALPERVVKC